MTKNTKVFAMLNKLSRLNHIRGLLKVTFMVFIYNKALGSKNISSYVKNFRAYFDWLARINI